MKDWDAGLQRSGETIERRTVEKCCIGCAGGPDRGRVRREANTTDATTNGATTVKTEALTKVITAQNDVQAKGSKDETGRRASAWQGFDPAGDY